MNTFYYHLKVGKGEFLGKKSFSFSNDHSVNNEHCLEVNTSFIQ